MSGRSVGQIDYDLRMTSAEMAIAEERQEYVKMTGIQQDLDDLLEERQRAAHDLEATS